MVPRHQIGEFISISARCIALEANGIAEGLWVLCQTGAGTFVRADRQKLRLRDFRDIVN